eukprot:Sspe_Gene.28678::Locus_13148_Transcript_2_2_Confidence_0.667_Length_1774::g.28678::m.28678/K06632/WEE1; wee1-like protein kinase
MDRSGCPTGVLRGIVTPTSSWGGPEEAWKPQTPPATPPGLTPGDSPCFQAGTPKGRVGEGRRKDQPATPRKTTKVGRTSKMVAKTVKKQRSPPERRDQPSRGLCPPPRVGGTLGMSASLDGSRRVMSSQEMDLWRSPGNATPDGSPFFVPASALGTMASYSSDVPGLTRLGTYATLFKEICLLGRGNFGHVVQAQHQLDLGHYAVKISNTAIGGLRDRNARLREAQALARCSCPHIVRYYSCWIEDKQLYLQTEFCEKGSVERMMKTPWTETELTTLLLQMALALQHLHDVAHIAHLDVKPDNIYVTASGVYKLGDFGHAHLLDHPARSPPSTPVTNSIDSTDSRLSFDEGDIRYLPLEMLNDKTRLCEADIFSLGISVYEIGSREALPRNDPSWVTLRENGLPLALLKEKGFSGELVRLIANMTHRDPLQRPSASRILGEYSRLWPDPTRTSDETRNVHPWVTVLAFENQKLREQLCESDLTIAEAP